MATGRRRAQSALQLTDAQRAVVLQELQTLNQLREMARHLRHQELLTHEQIGEQGFWPEGSEPPMTSEEFAQGLATYGIHNYRRLESGSGRRAKNLENLESVIERLAALERPRYAQLADVAVDPTEDPASVEAPTGRQVVAEPRGREATLIDLQRRVAALPESAETVNLRRYVQTLAGEMDRDAATSVVPIPGMAEPPTLEDALDFIEARVIISEKAAAPQEAEANVLTGIINSIVDNDRAAKRVRSQQQMEQAMRGQAAALGIDGNTEDGRTQINAALGFAGYAPLGSVLDSNAPLYLRGATGEIANQLRNGSLTDAQADELFGYIRTVSERWMSMDGMSDLIGDSTLDPNLIIQGMAGLLPSEARAVASDYVAQLESIYDTRRTQREDVRKQEDAAQSLRIKARTEIRRRDEDAAQRALDLDQALMDARMGVFRDVTRDPSLLTPTGVGARIGGADIYGQILASLGSVPAEFGEDGGQMVLPSVTPAFARAMSADEALNVPVTVEDILA